MQVVENIIELDSRWFSPEREVKRTKGLHLSHILDFIEGRQRDNDMGKSGHRFAVGGFLWERALDKLIHLSKEELWEYVFTQALFEIEKPDVFRPGEQCLDGGECPICGGSGMLRDPVRACQWCEGCGRIRIYMTPDGVSIEDQYLEEWKSTSKSSKTAITNSKFQRWVSWQIPAYLKAMNLLTCRLRVFFSRGNYTSNEPEWREFTLTFTQQEIDETWESICINARSLVLDLAGIA